jgi:hypothetical protein
LTSSADGKRAGLPFTILGGPHGHVPLHHTSGKAIADVVANGSLRLSILDMAQFPPGGAQHFFVDFIPRLMMKIRGVLYLVIEEAHEFAPKERAGFGKENMSIHYAKAVATGGRSKGIRLIVLDQRVQALHNAVLGSCETVIVHRMTQPADQEPVVKWMKANVKDKALREQITDSMPKLKTGTGWVCSGEANLFTLMEFPKAKTFDNSKTPDKDDDLAQVVKTAPVDVEALRGIIGEAVAEAEANDPAQLRMKIAELQVLIKEADVREANRLPVEPGEETRCQIDHESYGRECVKSGFEVGVQEARKQGENYIHKFVDDVSERLASTLQESADRTLTEFDPLAITIAQQMEISKKLLGTPVLMPPLPPISEKTLASGQWRFRETGDGVALNSVAHPAGKPVRKTRLSKDSLEKVEINVLGAAERTFLNVLAQRQNRVTTRDQLARFSLYSPTSRHVDNTLGRLRGAGYVEGPGTNIQITGPGLVALGTRTLMPTGAGLREAWLAKSGKAEAGFLSFLIHKYPHAVTRDDLAVATGYSPTSRHVDNTLGRLRALGLIVGPGSGIVASEDLF